MQGRLVKFNDSKLVALREQIDKETTWPWMKSHWPTFAAPDGALIQTLVGHTGRIVALAITPNGQHIVSSSRDNTLRIWETDSEHCKHVLKGHTSGVLALAITPDGQHIVSVTDVNKLCVWVPALDIASTCSRGTQLGLLPWQSHPTASI